MKHKKTMTYDVGNPDPVAKMSFKNATSGNCCRCHVIWCREYNYNYILKLLEME